MRLGVIGHGFVGKAVSQLGSIYEIDVYDPNIGSFCRQENKERAFSAQFVFCCVPTDSTESGSLDTTLVERSFAEFSKLSNPFGIFVVKSTVTPGTTSRMISRFGNDRIVVNPEFLTERTALQDFMDPVDIVIGANNSKYADAVHSMLDRYYEFGKHSGKYIFCTATEAELVKSARNSFYAAKISFMNELHAVCEKLELDYSRVREYLCSYGRHPWFNASHTSVPGPDGYFGFGGKCLPKDANDLLNLSRAHGVPMGVLEAALITNSRHRSKVASEKTAYNSQRLA